MTLIEIMDWLEANVIWTLPGLIASFFVCPLTWLAYMAALKRKG